MTLGFRNLSREENGLVWRIMDWKLGKTYYQLRYGYLMCYALK